MLACMHVSICVRADMLLCACVSECMVTCASVCVSAKKIVSALVCERE